MSSVLLDLTSDEYHADPCPEPSLNSTTARLLLSRTPAHAKAQHPRLSDVPLEPRTSEAMDMGTAVHQLLLKDDRIEVIPFDKWNTNEAKAMVADSLARGRVPVKPDLWKRAQNVAAAVRDQMDTLPKPTPFTAGKPEATITWQDGDAWLRARLDWLRDDYATIDDLKCTSRSADPRTWEKQLFSLGYDVQAALYIRAVEKTLGHTPRFRWVIAETYPPYAVSIVELSEPDMFAAMVKVDTAIQMWNECLAANSWPAYSTDVYVARAPAWAKAERDGWADVDLESVPF